MTDVLPEPVLPTKAIDSPLLILNLSVHGTPIVSDADFYLEWNSVYYENQFQEFESNDNYISDLGILEKYYLNFFHPMHQIHNTKNCH